MTTTATQADTTPRDRLRAATERRRRLERQLQNFRDGISRAIRGERPTIQDRAAGLLAGGQDAPAGDFDITDAPAREEALRLAVQAASAAEGEARNELDRELEAEHAPRIRQLEARAITAARELETVARQLWAIRGELVKAGVQSPRALDIPDTRAIVEWADRVEKRHR
jgi:hypothetical protein